MDSLFKYISITNRCVSLYRSERLEEYGLMGHQQIYIMVACKHPGISQDELAKHIHINKSNVTRQLAILEERGFITRTPAEHDRRQVQVYPTEKAKEMHPRVVEVLQEINDELVCDFTQEEKDLLKSMMKRVKMNAIDLAEERTRR